MWIFLISLFTSTCHKRDVVLLPVGEAEVVQQLENGNYEVTKAFVILTYDLAYQVKKLELELEKCREKGSVQ